MIMETIRLSLQEEHPQNLTSYLERKSNNEEDTSERIKDLFNEFVATGLGPNEAAAKAINQVAVEQEVKKQYMNLNGTVLLEMPGKMDLKLHAGDTRKIFADVLMKYLKNIKKNPSNPKFRNFKISNKVFDKITSSEGGIQFVQSVGFEIFHNESDFMCSVPLSADLDAMLEALESLDG